MEIKIENSKNLELYSSLSQELKQFIPILVFRVGARLEQNTKKKAKEVIYNRPVQWKRTGKLQQSIIHKNSNSQSNVYVGVTYAKNVEYGTRKSRAYPYFMPSVQKTSFEISGIWQSIIKSNQLF